MILALVGGGFLGGLVVGALAGAWAMLLAQRFARRDDEGPK